MVAEVINSMINFERFSISDSKTIIIISLGGKALKYSFKSCSKA